MILGGNKNLKQFFAEFDLLDEPASNKYTMQAAHWYRKQLRAQALDQEFTCERPEYSEGKTIMSESDF